MVKQKKLVVDSTSLLGSWSFLVGVILAVILGIGFGTQYKSQMLWAIFLLGIVIGLLNISSKEVSAFLTSGTVLVLVSYLGTQVGDFEVVQGTHMISNILSGVLTLFVPATIIVALKAVFVLAKK